MLKIKRRVYTEPVINHQHQDLSKDWYVFFQFKHEGKIIKFKKREGINRIKDLNERLLAIQKLADELSYDLKNGWNPLIDKKREMEYNPYLKKDPFLGTKVATRTKKQSMQDRINKFLNR